MTQRYAINTLLSRVSRGIDIPWCILTPSLIAKLEHRNSSTHQIRQLVNVFTRLHPFVVNSALGFTTSQRRQFCRDVYDYARGAGLSKPQARQEVIKARTICGEIDYESDDSSLEEEVDDTAEVMDSLSMRPQTHVSVGHLGSSF